MRIGVGTPQDYECVVPGGQVGLWGSRFGRDMWDCGGVVSGRTGGIVGELIQVGMINIVKY